MVVGLGSGSARARWGWREQVQVVFSIGCPAVPPGGLQAERSAEDSYSAPTLPEAGSILG